jgi:hypothetical protein
VLTSYIESWLVEALFCRTLTRRLVETRAALPERTTFDDDAVTEDGPLLADISLTSSTATHELPTPAILTFVVSTN